MKEDLPPFFNRVGFVLLWFLTRWNRAGTGPELQNCRETTTDERRGPGESWDGPERVIFAPGRTPVSLPRLGAPAPALEDSLPQGDCFFLALPPHGQSVSNLPLDVFQRLLESVCGGEEALKP